MLDSGGPRPYPYRLVFAARRRHLSLLGVKRGQRKLAWSGRGQKCVWGAGGLVEMERQMRPLEVQEQ